MLEDAIPSFSPNRSETPKALSSKKACIRGIIFFISNKIMFFIPIKIYFVGYFFIFLFQILESTT